MGLFSFFRSVKESLAYGVIVKALGLPTWKTHKYEDFAKEGYMRVAWVYACINEITSSVASVPWKLYQKRDKKELTDHPVLSLINKPNKRETRYFFFEQWAGFLAIAGNAFWELSLVGQKPVAMYTVRPDKMKIYPDQQNGVAKYVFEYNEYRAEFKPEQIIHFKFFNPIDELYGLSPIQVAARVVDTENALLDVNKSLIENGLKPEGAFCTEGKLTDAAFRRLKEQINVEYADSAKQGRPMLLEQGLKWQQIGLSTQDIQFINQKKLNRVDICAIFGVPPETVGDKEHATYSNYQEARRSFWEETVIPRYLDRLKEQINMTLVPMIDDSVYLDYDLSNVPAMRANFNELVENAYKLWQMGFPINQINEKLKLGFDPVPWGDTVLVNSSQLPIDMVVGGGIQGSEEDESTEL